MCVPSVDVSGIVSILATRVAIQTVEITPPKRRNNSHVHIMSRCLQKAFWQKEEEEEEDECFGRIAFSP